MAEKTNTKPYDVIKPGEPVVLLTYMVSLRPDGDEDAEYDPFPVHLRKRSEAIKDLDTVHPDENLLREILKRADKIERREHATPDDVTFTLGPVRLARQRLDVAI